MAKKFGKWRGGITAVCGFGLSLIGAFVARLEDLVHTFGPSGTQPEALSALGIIAIGLYALGMVVALWGAWQVYADANHGTYVSDAERYDREGW
ncbi:MAG: hypothetical protein RSG22_18315 [Comamonas sp.]